MIKYYKSSFLFVYALSWTRPLPNVTVNPV